MSTIITECVKQAKEYVIKNTFIAVADGYNDSNRRVSIPPSLRFFTEEQLPRKIEGSEVSTCREEDSDVSSGCYSPLWSPTSSVQSCFVVDRDYSSWSPTSSMQSTIGVHGDSLPLAPTSSLQSNGAGSDVSSQKPPKSGEHCYRARAERLLKRVVRELKSCDLLAHVEASCGFAGCEIRMLVDSESSIEMVSTLTKKTILEITSNSRCIYVMGYCSSNAFSPSSTGFEATLVAMENASKACWHMFKKGYCRHDDTCSKQHPSFRIPLKVLIDAPKYSTTIASSNRAIWSDFRLLLVGLVHTLKTSLEQNPFIECVRSREDSDGHWSIELHADRFASQNEDCVLADARNQVVAILDASRAVQIVEHSGWSFVPKPNGFVVLLGESSCPARASGSISVVAKMN